MFVCIQYEWTDCSVRTNISTLITLDTVFHVPYRNECSYTTFFVECSTIVPSSVLATNECRYRNIISFLSINRTNNLFDEIRSIIICRFTYCDVCPFCRYFYFFNFDTSVNCRIVLIDYIFTFTSIRLNDEFLHLFYC